METIISEEQRKIMDLFDVIIKDMYIIVVTILPEKIPKAKQEVFNRLTSEQAKIISQQELENRPYFMLSVLDYILDKMENNKEITNSQLFKFIRLFLDSAVKLNQQKYEFDEISNKNILSFIIYSYCCLECLAYLIQKKNELNPLRKSFDDKNYENLHNYIESNSLTNGIKSMFNSFQTQFFISNKEKGKTKDSRDRIYCKFLKSVNETNFKEKYESYVIKVKAERKKKRDKKKEKNQDKNNISLDEKTNMESLNSISSIQEDDVKENQIHDSPKKEDAKQQELSSVATILIEPKPQIPNEAIESINISKKNFEALVKQIKKISEDLEKSKKKNIDLEGKLLEYGDKNSNLEEKYSELTKEIDTIKKNNKILMDNQRKLWNYLDLLSNGRDMIKSIIFHLYQYFGLKGKEKPFHQLSELLESLHSGELNEKLKNIQIEKLNQFLLLTFFLKNFLNKYLHREFKLENISIDEDDKNVLKIIPDQTFDSFFTSLETFVEEAKLNNQIQELISQTIKDYIKDESLSEELKYKEGKIFKENQNKFVPVLNKDDITSIFNFLKGIKINGKEFGKLCENKIWKDDFMDDFIAVPQFYNSQMNFDNQS